MDARRSVWPEEPGGVCRWCDSDGLVIDVDCKRMFEIDVEGVGFDPQAIGGGGVDTGGWFFDVCECDRFDLSMRDVQSSRVGFNGRCFADRFDEAGEDIARGCRDGVVVGRRRGDGHGVSDLKDLFKRDAGLASLSTAGDDGAGECVGIGVWEDGCLDDLAIDESDELDMLRGGLISRFGV